jgi:hypothetical protein
LKNAWDSAQGDPKTPPPTATGLVLNKQEFRDPTRLRYNLPLSDLPSFCTCGTAFTVNHGDALFKEIFKELENEKKRKY